MKASEIIRQQHNSKIESIITETVESLKKLSPNKTESQLRKIAKGMFETIHQMEITAELKR
jgi:hypothetical protein